MLERLTVANLALVESAAVELLPGLNVVTGETGAGKSLLVQSVGLLLGERADADVVREGEKSAVVEGEFRVDGPLRARLAARLAEWGIDMEDGAVIVRREVQAGGKSRATVNQGAVTLASLKRLAESLVDLHGQHEHQSLLRPDAGLETLDRLARLERERAAYGEARDAWRAAREALDALASSLATLADRRAAMEEAAREIAEAHLVAGEDEELAREAARLAHADRLRELVTLALERLSEGETPADAALREAAHAVDQAAALDPSVAEAASGLAEARLALAEAVRGLEAYASGLEADPRALEEVEARRERIARLTRKHRRDVPGLLAWRAELERELAAGENAEGVLARASAEEAAARAACRAAGETLATLRREAAIEWSARITHELRPLGMRHARLQFEVEPDPDAESLPAHGLDRVTIRFTANPGEPPRPLQRIASGGELSRVMLALKAALETQDAVDVLIFDEVDSGIGGAVAQAVGERLRRLARHRQLICVTHLPMIAALASHHLRVSKHVSGKRTQVRIDPLDPDQRVEELARMLAGDLATGTTRRQARELLAATGAGA